MTSMQNPSASESAVAQVEREDALKGLSLIRDTLERRNFLEREFPLSDQQDPFERKALVVEVNAPFQKAVWEQLRRALKLAEIDPECSLRQTMNGKVCEYQIFFKNKTRFEWFVNDAIRDNEVALRRPQSKSSQLG